VVAEQCTAPKSSGDSGRLRNITAPSVSVNDSTDAHELVDWVDRKPIY